MAVAALSANLALGRTLSSDEVEASISKCERGNLETCDALGLGYSRGAFVPEQDYAKARYYLQKACTESNVQKDKSLSTSCNELGELYEKGRGVSQNYQNAVKYYSIACDAGDFLGCFRSAFTRDMVMHDNGEAIKYYARACEVGKNDDKAQKQS